MSDERINILITALNREFAENLAMRLASDFPGLFLISTFSFIKQPRDLQTYDVYVSGALNQRLDEDIREFMPIDRIFVYTNSTPDAKARAEQGYTVYLYDAEHDRVSMLREAIIRVGKRQ